MLADNQRDIIDSVLFQLTARTTSELLSRGFCLPYCSSISGYEIKVSTLMSYILMALNEICTVNTITIS